MSSIGEICAKMDGLVGTMATSTDAGQYVAAWVQSCKDIMRLPANRGLTTWKFQAISSITKTGPTEVGAADLIAATKLYGLMLASVDDTAEDNFVAVYDADSATFDGSAALANSVVAVIRPDTVAAATTEEYIPMVWHKGLALGTGLTIAADGVDGTDTTAAELRGWILFI